MTGVPSFPLATPASKRIQGLSKLRSVNRHTTSEVDWSCVISLLYHSSPKSVPSVPFLSDERNVFIIPALTLFSNLLNASARSASRELWRINTSGLDAIEGSNSLSGGAFDFSDLAIFLPPRNVIVTCCKRSAIRSCLPANRGWKSTSLARSRALSVIRIGGHASLCPPAAPLIPRISPHTRWRGR